MPSSPLDAPVVPTRRRTTQKVLLGLEILCWALVLATLLLRHASWAGAGNLLLVLLSLLSLIYLLLPIPLMDSEGWKQHLWAHTVGLVLMLALWVLMANLDGWGYALEMILVAAPLCTLLLVVTLVQWLVGPAQRRLDDFYRHAALRLAVGAVLSVISGLL